VTQEHAFQSSPSESDHTTRVDRLFSRRKRLKRCVILSEEDEELSVDKVLLTSQEVDNSGLQKKDSLSSSAFLKAENHEKKNSFSPVLKKQLKGKNVYSFLFFFLMQYNRIKSL
jgi:hypothetical protein